MAVMRTLTSSTLVRRQLPKKFQPKKSVISEHLGKEITHRRLRVRHSDIKQLLQEVDVTVIADELRLPLI